MKYRVLAGVIVSLAVSACGVTGGSPGSAASPGTNGAPVIVSRAQAGSAGLDTGPPAGPGCASVPARGTGSFAAMAGDPVATAASHSPLLSDLATAVRQAKLFTALNAATALTVFAPDNAAFGRVTPAEQATIAAGGPALAKIISYHVVIGRVTPAQLGSGRTLHTLEGGTITTSGGNGHYQVGSAQVICGNVQTKNATIYIINSVLMP